MMDGFYELMVYSIVLVGLGALLGWGLRERFQRRKSREPQVITYIAPAAYDSVTTVNEDSVATWHVLYQAKR